MLRKRMISGIGSDGPIPLIIAAIVAKQAEAISMRTTLIADKNQKLKVNVVDRFCLTVLVLKEKRKF